MRDDERLGSLAFAVFSQISYAAQIDEGPVSPSLNFPACRLRHEVKCPPWATIAWRHQLSGARCIENGVRRHRRAPQLLRGTVTLGMEWTLLDSALLYNNTTLLARSILHLPSHRALFPAHPLPAFNHRRPRQAPPRKPAPHLHSISEYLALVVAPGSRRYPSSSSSLMSVLAKSPTRNHRGSSPVARIGLA